MFSNPSAPQIARPLRSARTVAVVGLSASPARPSHGAARALDRAALRQSMEEFAGGDSSVF